MLDPLCKILITKNCVPFEVLQYSSKKMFFFRQYSRFDRFDSLRPSQQFFSYVKMCLPVLNHNQARINAACSTKQCSDINEAQTHTLLFCKALGADLH